LLIASQKPNASYVAGFRAWNELGRFVKKGEKGIMILAPIIRRKVLNDDEEREEISRPIAGFRAAFVFDISQGKPIVSPWLVKWKKVAPPKTVQRELPYFTVAQMAAIVNSAKTQLNRALFALAAGTGARAGELFALRVETDVNLNEQTITIRRSVSKEKKTRRRLIRVTRTEPARCPLMRP